MHHHFCEIAKLMAFYKFPTAAGESTLTMKNSIAYSWKKIIKKELTDVTRT